MIPSLDTPVADWAAWQIAAIAVLALVWLPACRIFGTQVGTRIGKRFPRLFQAAALLAIILMTPQIASAGVRLIDWALFGGQRSGWGTAMFFVPMAVYCAAALILYLQGRRTRTRVDA